ncbi:class I SAM-dependent methyltransferase [Occultella glacieicola]|uniref:Class I SAM-dependent methyltransferase n=1 Tax=Occultella glacieicola TaxID=2518684 RepID=A0ABY2E3T0_9MICO|nr:class I SAM-dependent methyltransferase [Occultella glacieicola]TDE94067.1 class I SAM-dependent methyltransferase [Occultella glacieicola]
MGRRTASAVVGSRVGLAIVRSAMRNPHVRAELLLSLSDKMARTADWDTAQAEPAFRVPAERFEDLVWLFSSNWLNHRFTRLDFDEAAYLYRILAAIDRPRMAELGRFRGGSTVFYAASGARVTSIDGNPKQDVWGPELERVLDRMGLREQVDLVVGDTRLHEPGPDPYDLVFFDASVSGDGIRAEIENWWPAIAVGGHAVFRDGRAQLPHLLPVQEEVDRFVGATPEADRRRDREVPGCFVHVIKTA